MCIKINNCASFPCILNKFSYVNCFFSISFVMREVVTQRWLLLNNAYYYCTHTCIRIHIFRCVVIFKYEKTAKLIEENVYFCFIHTYIIGHYNPSVRIIDLVSHTTYVVCINFMHKWWDLQINTHNIGGVRN